MSSDQGKDWLAHTAPTLDDWEARLQPKRSSNTLLILLAAMGAALVVFIAVWGSRDMRSIPPSPATSQPDAPARTPEFSTAIQRNTMKPIPQEPLERVARCVSASGSVVYTDQPCRQGERAGLVELRPDRNLVDGMSVEARQASNRSSELAAQQLAAHERRVAMNVTQAGSECAQLDSLIAALDAAARLPQPGSEQDRLRQERKRARDRQFALRCG